MDTLGEELGKNGRHGWTGCGSEVDGKAHEAGQRRIIADEVGAETCGDLDRGVVYIQTCDADSVRVHTAACIAAIACSMLAGQSFRKVGSQRSGTVADGPGAAIDDLGS